MNTDKILNNKFIENKDHPIWYYKELKPIEVDYVIWNLLKETFVVEIEGSKHEIIFGKNRKGEIGQCIRYDDIENSNLTSYKVIEKGFKQGKWFIVTSADTSDKFKDNYNKRKEEYNQKSIENMYREILNNVINDSEKLTEEQKNEHKQDIENSSFEELEKLMNILIKGDK
jgi:hypothetical protein